MLISGIHAVSELLREDPKRVVEVLVSAKRAKDSSLRELLRAARSAGAKIRQLDPRELDRLTGGLRHQGVAVRVQEERPPDLPRFLAGLSEAARSALVLVALDQIQDPHNLGAIIRSAACLGAGGLIVPERRSASVTPVVHQASAGAVSRIPLFHVVNLAQALIMLKKAGFWVYGADMAGEPSWTKPIAFPLVLVIGSEGSGLRPLVRANCDALLTVPLSERGVGSLNASCAASVLLYEVQRRKAVP